MQRLSFANTYRSELKLYKVIYADHASPSRDEIEDNLIPFANVVILYGIQSLKDGFITEYELNKLYEKVATYVDNRDILGTIKVYAKISEEVVKDMLHRYPFFVFLE